MYLGALTLMAPCHYRTQLKLFTAGCRSAEASEAVCLEDASHFARMLFYQRLRTPADRQQVAALFESVWDTSIEAQIHPELSISPQCVQIGKAGLARPGANHPNTGKPVALISCRLGDSRCFGTILQAWHARVPVLSRPALVLAAVWTEQSSAAGRAVPLECTMLFP